LEVVKEELVAAFGARLSSISSLLLFNKIVVPRGDVSAIPRLLWTAAQLACPGRVACKEGHNERKVGVSQLLVPTCVGRQHGGQVARHDSVTELSDRRQVPSGKLR